MASHSKGNVNDPDSHSHLNKRIPYLLCGTVSAISLATVYSFPALTEDNSSDNSNNVQGKRNSNSLDPIHKDHSNNNTKTAADITNRKATSNKNHLRVMSRKSLNLLPLVQPYTGKTKAIKPSRRTI
jgi:hypothetical protein